MDYTIQAKRLYIVLINKKRTYLIDFAFPIDQSKRKRKTEQIPGPCLNIEQVLEHEGDSDTRHNWSLWNSAEESRKIKTIQTTTLLKSAMILKRVLQV